jgi:hypothetical protein
MSWEYQSFSKSLGDVVCPNTGSLPLDGGLPTTGAGAWRVAVTIEGAVARIFSQQAPKGWEAAGASDSDSLWRTGRVDATVIAPGPSDGAGVIVHAVRLDCRRLLRSPLASSPR